MLFYDYNIPEALTVKRPARIVSLVPSQTELLYDLGLDDQVIAITKFCVHPQEWFRKKQRIGGTKNIHLSKIIDLEPDLVIANKEENVKEQITVLGEYFPVYVSDIRSVTDTYKMMDAVGRLTAKEKEVAKLVKDINYEMDKLRRFQPSRTCAYLIWKDPYMTVGGDTFIHEMLSACGFRNVFTEYERYPSVDLAAIQADFILLSSEPYPFGEKHVEEFRSLFPGSEILLVDGEMFSWYGSRMKYAPGYFNQLLDRYR